MKEENIASASVQLPEESVDSETADMILTSQLMNWLDESPCNFMAVGVIIEELEDNGFERLETTEKWNIEPGGKYYVVQNDTAIFAFVAGSGRPSESGFHIISSHCDSPCFKLKPNPEIYGDGGIVSLNVEKYGGGIMYTWFDRPLSMAARLQLRSDDPMRPITVIVDLGDPVAVIPHLAIHFNRGVNDGNPLSVQKDMKPVLGTFDKETFDELMKMGGVVKCMFADTAEISPEEIIGMETVLYPVEKATLAGAHNEFIMSGRLDDLSMAFSSLQAILTTSYSPVDATRVVAIFDNEETGSGTRQGAAAPTLRNILERITASLEKNWDQENFFRAIANSFMISADDAHAWHPNYNEKYDPTNHPVIGGGPVIKINANCKYMTDSRGDAVFHALCEKAGVKCQYFVNHGDVAGGSTLGNILTSQMDLAGVDMGCAIWAMHSACETAGVRDHLDTIRVFSEFFSV